MNGLVLWDVDHTLIENSGVSKRTYATAFERLTGRPAQHLARTFGRTDPEIMADLFADHGLSHDAFGPDDVRRALVDSLARLRTALVEVGWALPGARDSIDAVTDLGVVQSVLTGNVRENGYVKLAAFDLADRLDWESGAYGFDAEDRAGLVAVAQKRAQSRHGTQFGALNTILIGDTVNDVQAGRRGGAYVIAVATGVDDAPALIAAGADVVLNDLTSTDQVIAAVASLLRTSA
jgi:phosphoglycolate phosphatase-like HAD superfamily hydrolase